MPDPSSTPSPAHGAAFASVAVADLPIDRTYSYAIPGAMRETVTVGRRVEVPFGKAARAGYVVALTETPDCPPEKCRSIVRALDREPIVDLRMLEFTRWIADYYCCGWGQALDAVLPTGVRRQTKEKTLRWVILTEAGRARAAELGRIAAAGGGRVPTSSPLKELPPDRITIPVSEQGMTEDGPVPAPADSSETPPATLLGALAAADGPLPAEDLARRAGTSSAPLLTLAKQGLVRIEKRRVTDPLLEMPLDLDAAVPPALTAAQAAALRPIAEAVEARTFRTFLLHGVTGSGKTEVYLQALARVLAQDRQAIVLVPEIALTPQTVGRFRARFPNVAVLHSHLAEGARAAQWSRIRSGEAQIVIGARSAVFAPTRSLGLIVVDEEHEPTFKQESTPRYHARDVAVKRAQMEGAVVILGSATPALESYRNALQGRYTLLRMPERVESRPLPPVEICDLGAEFRAQKRYPLLSRQLVLRIRAALANKEQVLLFLNRRGFVTLLICSECKMVFRCRRCEVALTVHKSRDAAICHHCNERQPVPRGCPACGAGRIRQLGVGTERIEEEVRREFPGIAAGRMDSDAMKSGRDYTHMLGGLRIGEVDLLVGTQMIAKGLDYPNVTVVGVITADTALHLKDFRSAERTFQLLTQVAGRAGRGPRGGVVCVQTFHPTHYAIAAAQTHDYEGFAARELEFRKLVGYPPFTRMVRFVVEGESSGDVEGRARMIAETAAEHLPAEGGDILGPLACPFPRIRDRWRWHVCLRAVSRATLDAVLRPLRAGTLFAPRHGITVTVDVDPQSML
ncbi:MAG: primosomal protein N' [Planctomycetes bacterium]|nr:primosomal protein N' [Planctomycetota bacterium]